MQPTTSRTIRGDISSVVSSAKNVAGKVGGVIQKAKNAVANLGKERYDRSTYVDPKVADQSLIKRADAILSNRPNIINESDYRDPDFQTVVNASKIRGGKASK